MDSVLVSVAVGGVGLFASLISIIQFVWGISNWTEMTFSRGFVSKPIHIDKTLNFFDKGNYQAQDISAETFNALAGTEFKDGSFFIGVDREGLPARNYLCVFRFHQGHLTKVRIYRIKGNVYIWVFLEQVGIFVNLSENRYLVNIFTKIARPFRVYPGTEGHKSLYARKILEWNGDRLKIIYNKTFDYVMLDGKKIDEYGDEYIEIRIHPNLSIDFVSSY